MRTLPLALGSSLSTVLIAAAVAGGCTEPSTTSCRLSAIVNGEIAFDAPAVVALTTGGAQFCTGTLVSPRVVVTAAHCLPPNVDFPADQIEIAFGVNVETPDMLIPVVEVFAHPAWTLNDLPDDVGVARLAFDAPVAPAPMARTPITVANIGQMMELVGYGVTGLNETDNGLRRHGLARIAGSDEFSIHLEIDPSGTCFGDSGGPAFLDVGGNLVFAGIHSRSDCEFSSLDERVDIHVDSFIEPFIAGMAPAFCSMDGQCASGCADPDPDCPCAGDGFCGAACTDAAMDSDCPTGCADDGSCVTTGCPAPDPDCAECAADGECDLDCTADPDCAC